MKTFITSLLLLFTAITALCARHLDFNGIAIDGTIGSFTRKLERQGHRLNPQSKTMPAGKRWFDSNDRNLGPCTIVACYNPKNKMMHSVSVIFEYTDYQTALQLFETFKQALGNKYGEASFMESLPGDPPYYGVGVDNADGTPLGTVSVRVEQDNVTGTGLTFLFLDFEDNENCRRYRD